MSAEILRKAAALMRERAEAMTALAGAEWVVAEVEPTTSAEHRVLGQYAVVHDGETILALVKGFPRKPTVEHIASWHPAVALAVATVLEAVAEAWPVSDPDYWSSVRAEALGHRRALDAARLYLGSADD